MRPIISLLVIILIVHHFNILPNEPEGQAPVTGHGYSPMPFQRAFKGMQPPSRQIHVLRRFGGIQSGKLGAKTVFVHSLNAGFTPCSEKPLKPLVSEGLNHGCSVKRMYT